MLDGNLRKKSFRLWMLIGEEFDGSPLRFFFVFIIQDGDYGIL